MTRSTTLKRSPLRRQSSKQARKQRGWNRITADKKLRFGDVCPVRSPVCIGGPCNGHHVIGKGVGGAWDESNHMLSCDPCNTYIEDRPMWARANGFKRRSWEAAA